jgi:hypothetical protein
MRSPHWTQSRIPSLAPGEEVMVWILLFSIFAQTHTATALVAWRKSIYDGTAYFTYNGDSTPLDIMTKLDELRTCDLRLFQFAQLDVSFRLIDSGDDDDKNEIRKWETKCAKEDRCVGVVKS